MVTINIKFDKTLKVISGNDLGEKIFNEQVKQKIDYEDMNLIIFGKEIQVIGISFVQGFTKEIFNNIPHDKFLEHFIIEGSDRAVKKFLKALKY